MRLADLPDRLNEISGHVLDAAIEVHRVLGRNLSETTYRNCIEHELKLRGYRVQTEVALPLVYKDLVVPNAYRIDVLVEDSVVVELKCVQELLPEHEAQLMTYLYASGCKLGLVVNFHAALIRDGFLRRAN